MPPKVPTESSTAAGGSNSAGGSKSVSDSDVELNPNEAAFLQFFMKFEDRFSRLDAKLDSAMSKFEAQSFAEFEGLRSPPAGNDALQGRLSLGSNRTGSSSQNSQVGKSSFRLEKPKFEYPKDPKVDGALDESILKFIDECESHIVIWKTLPENKDKVFEGSENFALVSLPTSVRV
jgi:hypothetical protein